MLLASLSGLKPRKRLAIFSLNAGNVSAGSALMIGYAEASSSVIASESVGPTRPKAGATRSWAEQTPATSAVLH